MSACDGCDEKDRRIDDLRSIIRAMVAMGSATLESDAERALQEPVDVWGDRDGHEEVAR